MHADHVSVLVANSKSAHLFGGTSKGDFVLQETITLDHKAQADSPHTDPKVVAADRFAHQLSQMLTHRIQADAATSLVLVADPHFLGVLRGALSAQVTKHVTRSLDKDLVDLEPSKLIERLTSEFATSAA